MNGLVYKKYILSLTSIEHFYCFIYCYWRIVKLFLFFFFIIMSNKAEVRV